MKLASLFSDAAVLQRNQTVPIWGQTEPDSFVEALIGDSKAFGASSSSGRFMIRLPPMEAGGPYTLTVRNLTHGDECTVQDVMVGEVWLASGQSNMEFSMKSSPLQLADYRNNNPAPGMIRMISVPQSASSVPQDYFSEEWQYSTNENIEYFSAAALWFARKISENLGVSVGIIRATWGGTAIESWTSRSTLLRNPDTCETVLANDLRDNQRPAWQIDLTNIRGRDKMVFDQEEYLRKYAVPDSGNQNFALGWADCDIADDNWKTMKIPGDWIKQRIGGHGAAWFRKEVLIPEEWNDRELILDFCGIDKHDITYFNGTVIGSCGCSLETEHWNSARRYKIPAKIVKSGKAVIAIRVYSFAFGAGFNGSESACKLTCLDNGKSIPLSRNWKAQMEKEVAPPPPIETYSASGPGNPNTFSALFNTMIRPLIPYAVKGVIWNQGEANASSSDEGLKYQRKMTGLIEDWRFQWQQMELPFIITIISGFSEKYEYDPDDGWPFLRESQRRCSETMDDVYPVSAVDLGEVNDIHAKDKRSVGYRLARRALASVYGVDALLPGGPEFIRMRREGEKLRLFFRYADGLHTTGPQLDGFFIAGRDHVFYRADAVVDGNCVVAASSAVSLPCSVRYAWSRNPIANLVNRDNLPTLPFESGNTE